MKIVLVIHPMPHAYGFAFALICHLAVLTWVAVAMRRSAAVDTRLRYAFLLALLITVLWTGAALWRQAVEESSSVRLMVALDLLRYVAWFGLLQRALTLTLSVKPAWTRILVPISLTGMVLWFWGAQTTDVALVRLIWWALTAHAVIGLMLVEQWYRNTAAERRWLIKPLCLGLAGGFAFDMYVFSQAVLFAGLDQDAYQVRPLIATLALPLLLIGMRRLSHGHDRVQISHQAAFYTASLVLSGTYLLLIAAIGYYIRYFGGEWGRSLQLTLIFAAVVIGVLVTLSGSMRARLRVFVGKHFFAYRYDYREQWLRFTNILSTPATPPEMGLLVLKGLTDLVESTDGSLWLRDGEDGDFIEAARTRELIPVTRMGQDDPIVRFMHHSGWIIDVDECRRRPVRYQGLALPNWLAPSQRVWAVVPLPIGEQLLGFVVLATPRTTIDLDWEVRDLLKTASRQAAAFLAQLQAADALLESRKFEAFNRMSAFVVHDLKNIVTQLSLMMKNARRLQDNPEFQQDMLITVESSLEKMKQLMVQLREGEKPAGTQSGVALQPVLMRLAADAARRGRQIDCGVMERVFTRGHDERISRVLGHLVQNALDATPESGRVWLELVRSSGQVHVTVGDTGCGMAPEFIERRLFKPFQTTKQAGMGIGLFESHQYVKELGGRIEIDSEPGRGTLITVILPLLETRSGSDLHMTTLR